MKSSTPIGILLLSMVLAQPAIAQTAEEKVDAVLTALHEAASNGEFNRYFGLYADEAVFFGTDVTERWTTDEFKEYAGPAFADGHGWTFVTTERHIFVAEDGKTAWFDELQKHDRYGVTRGTGALVLRDQEWKIVQYHLTVPIPNALLLEFAEKIRELQK